MSPTWAGTAESTISAAGTAIGLVVGAALAILIPFMVLPLVVGIMKRGGKAVIGPFTFEIPPADTGREPGPRPWWRKRL
jgi:hypothetical protein